MGKSLFAVHAKRLFLFLSINKVGFNNGFHPAINSYGFIQN